MDTEFDVEYTRTRNMLRGTNVGVILREYESENGHEASWDSVWMLFDIYAQAHPRSSSSSLRAKICAVSPVCAAYRDGFPVLFEVSTGRTEDDGDHPAVFPVPKGHPRSATVEAQRVARVEEFMRDEVGGLGEREATTRLRQLLAMHHVH